MAPGSAETGPAQSQVRRDEWAESLSDATLHHAFEAAQRQMLAARRAHEDATAKWSRLLAEKCRREDVQR